MNRIVSFTQMKHGTREDYALLDESERNFARGLPEQILGALRALDHSLEGYPVSRLGHILQTATRARNDGADEELVAGALIHDIGDMLAPYNHAEVAAGIIRPYVRAEVTWIVEQHGLVQSYYYAHHLGGNRSTLAATATPVSASVIIPTMRPASIFVSDMTKHRSIRPSPRYRSRTLNP